MSDEFTITPAPEQKEEKRPVLAKGNAPPSPQTSPQDFTISPSPSTGAVIGNWYDEHVARPYRKAGAQGAVIGLGMLGPAAALSTPLRIAFMTTMGGGAEAYAQLVGRALGAKDTPKTSGEAALEIGKEGAIQGGAEVLGAGLTEVASKIGSTAVKAKELLDFARKWDMPLSGPEATGGATGKLVQTLGQSMVGGRGFGEAMRTKFFAGLNVGVEDTVQSFAKQLTQAEAGQEIKSGFKIAQDNFRKMSTSMYEGFLGRVESIAGKSPVVDFSKEALEEGKKIVGEIGQARMKYPEFKEPADIQKLMKSFVPQAGYGIPAERMTETQLPKLTIREAQTLRSWIRDLKGSENKEVQRLAFRFEKVVDDGMKSALDKIPTEGKATLKTELDAIDASYHEGKELFEGKAFKTLVDKYPEHMAHDIGLTDVTAMGDVKKALVKYGQDPEKWNLFRRMWLQDKIGAAEMTDAEPGQRLAKGVADLADSFKSKAKPMADEFFADPTGRRVLDNIDKFAQLTRSKVGLNVRSDSHLFVNYSIVHALLLGALKLGGRSSAALATAMIPAGLTRLMFNDAATDAVVGAMGAAAKAGTALTPGQIAQIARAVRLANQGYDIAKDEK